MEKEVLKIVLEKIGSRKKVLALYFNYICYFIDELIGFEYFDSMPGDNTNEKAVNLLKYVLYNEDLLRRAEDIRDDILNLEIRLKIYKKVL